MAVNDGENRGWPFVNYAMSSRGTPTSVGPSRQTIVYPRFKFTYIAELVINPSVLQSAKETNLVQYIDNGRIYAVLKSIEKPKTTIAHEKLRSYNKNVNVPTKVEHQQSNMVFHDDNASLSAALWREIRAFYQFEGRIGNNAVLSGDPARSLVGEYRHGSTLIGDAARDDMLAKPSLGMTIKNNESRHYFDAIYIYDLGSEPDSVNLYVYVYPFVTSASFDTMDHEDAQGISVLNMSFDYEGYYHLIGLNNAHFSQVAEQYLGYSMHPSPRVQGHAIMTPDSSNTEYIRQPLSQNSSLNFISAGGDFTIPFVGPR